MSANMIVGRVDTYGHSGNVENRRTFTDYRQFKRQVLHDLNCGRPIVIVANKIPGIGVRTPTQWVTEEGGLAVGGVKYESWRIVRFKYGPIIWKRYWLKSWKLLLQERLPCECQ